jgi:hypothetical protein
VKKEYVAIVSPVIVEPEINREIAGNVDNGEIEYIKRLKQSNITDVFVEYLDNSMIFENVCRKDKALFSNIDQQNSLRLNLSVTKFMWYPKDAALKACIGAAMGATIVGLPGVLVLPLDGELKVTVQLEVVGSNNFKEIITAYSSRKLGYCALNSSEVWDKEQSVIYSDCFGQIIQEIESMNFN